MGQLHRQKVTRLEKADRKQFDRTYVDIVRENLSSMIPYFEKEGRAAKSARVRKLVNDELPTLRQNLQAAERLNRQSQSSQVESGNDTRGGRRPESGLGPPFCSLRSGVALAG